MMNKEYIEREAIMEQITKEGVFYQNHKAYINLSNINKIVLGLPAADVEPVRHGKWRYYTIGVVPYQECSICGKHSPSGLKTFYCPNCGAKMDGGSK